MSSFPDQKYPYLSTRCTTPGSKTYRHIPRTVQGDLSSDRWSVQRDHERRRDDGRLPSVRVDRGRLRGRRAGRRTHFGRHAGTGVRRPSSPDDRRPPVDDDRDRVRRPGGRGRVAPAAADGRPALGRGRLRAAGHPGGGRVRRVVLAPLRGPAAHGHGPRAGRVRGRRPRGRRARTRRTAVRRTFDRVPEQQVRRGGRPARSGAVVPVGSARTVGPVHGRRPSGQPDGRRWPWRVGQKPRGTHGAARSAAAAGGTRVPVPPALGAVLCAHRLARVSVPGRGRVDRVKKNDTFLY